MVNIYNIICIYMPETNKKMDAYCQRKRKDKFGCLNFVRKNNQQSNNKSNKMQCAAKIKQWVKN